MANFRIDELELNRTAAGKYSLIIRANTDKLGTDEVSGTVTGQELIFFPGGISGNKRVTFKCDEINFNGYSDNQYLLISIYDNSTPVALKKRKGGVVIADTNYPPPGGSMDPFTTKFIVQKLVVKRAGLTDAFTMETWFSHDAAMAEYTHNSADFRSDGARNPNQNVMIYSLNENPANPASLPVYCYANDIKFEPYPAILPFFVMKHQAPWAAVDKKKGMLFIEST